MRLEAENTCRRIDNLGRIVIPKGLRDRLGIKSNDELEYYVMEYEGKKYICLRTVNMIETSADLELEAMGLDLGDLKDKLKEYDLVKKA